MPTISDRSIIDVIIKSDGYYLTDRRVLKIVEYDNAWGGTAWGVCYDAADIQGYETPTVYIRNPRTLWEAK